jgi:hypothetical protein
LFYPRTRCCIVKHEKDLDLRKVNIKKIVVVVVVAVVVAAAAADVTTFRAWTSNMSHLRSSDPTIA